MLQKPLLTHIEVLILLILQKLDNFRKQSNFFNFYFSRWRFGVKPFSNHIVKLTKTELGTQEDNFFLYLHRHKKILIISPRGVTKNGYFPHTEFKFLVWRKCLTAKNNSGVIFGLSNHEHWETNNTLKKFQYLVK